MMMSGSLFCWAFALTCLCLCRDLFGPLLLPARALQSTKFFSAR